MRRKTYCVSIDTQHVHVYTYWYKCVNVYMHNMDTLYMYSAYGGTLCATHACMTLMQMKLEHSLHH